MINEGPALVVDVDGTIAGPVPPGGDYLDAPPNLPMIEALCAYKELGFYIIIHTARNMRTHQGNHGKLIAETARDLFAWLERYEVPYDELLVGKPWPGHGGLIIDDRAVRPHEFLTRTYDELLELVEESREFK